MASYNLIQAPAVWLLETCCDQLWGFKPNIVVPLVKQKGAVRSLFWFATNMLKYEGILERWGPIRTHLLVTSISALNACPYTTFGHAFALELVYLRQTGRLYPLTERDFVNLCGQDEADILSTIERSLIDAELSSEVLSLQRMSELRQRPELATTRPDRDLVHLNKMFATLNFCGVKNAIRSDQAHDPINKDRAMRDRYFALRKGQRRSQGKSQRSQPAAVQNSDVTVLNPADIATSTPLDW